jgi:hypothetical protein
MQQAMALTSQKPTPKVRYARTGDAAGVKERGMSIEA